MDPLPAFPILVSKSPDNKALALTPSKSLLTIDGPTQFQIGKPFPVKGYVAFVAIRDMKTASDRVFTLREQGFAPTHPLPSACLADDHHVWKNDMPSFITNRLLGIPLNEPTAHFVVEDTELGLKSTLVYYPEGRESASVAIEDGPAIRFLEQGWIRTEQPGLLKTSIDNIAVSNIRQIEFTRDLHQSRITITTNGDKSPDGDAMIINLPNGGEELRQQLDTLETDFHKNCPNVSVQEHYSASSANFLVGFDILLLVAAFIVYFLGKRSGNAGCASGFLFFGILWFIVSIIYVLTDSQLHDFMSAS